MRRTKNPLHDVLLLNRYFGWYVFTGDLVAAEHALETELREWAQRGKPIVMTEYGADTQSGLHSLTSEPWSEEFQVDLLAMYHRVFDRIDAVVGEQVWNFADFATRSGISRVEQARELWPDVEARVKASDAAAYALCEEALPEAERALRGTSPDAAAAARALERVERAIAPLAASTSRYGADTVALILLREGASDTRLRTGH